MKNKIAFYSLLTAIVGLIDTPHNVYAAVHVNNAARSRAEAYNSVSAYQSQKITDADSLPVRVADSELARKLIQGDTSIHVTFTDLNNCKATFPTAEFAWDKPNVGLSSNKDDQCVGVVKMYGYQMGPGGSNLLLATANLPLDGTIKCNISEFPESGYATGAGQITFPADNEPTMDDVKRAMDREQKQNAGLKIAAMALTSGVIGNMVGKNSDNSGQMFGTNKEKIVSTAIGATSGAALATIGAYSGKVAGDAIVTAGTAAAGGAILGNITASTNSDASNKLRIEKCTIDGDEKTCLWGYAIETKNSDQKNESLFHNLTLNKSYKCNPQGKKCTTVKLFNAIAIDGAIANKSIDSLNQDDIKRSVNDQIKYKIYTDQKDKDCSDKFECISKAPTETEDIAIKNDVIIKVTAAIKEKSIPAMINFSVGNTFSGLTTADWRKKYRATYERKYYNRQTGTELSLTANYEFEPMTIGADDDHGNIIDLNNKARLGATIKGAAFGAGAGALTGIQGANQEISERYVSAVAEYNGSLQKIFCQSGDRYLGKYNDTVEIPKVQ